MNHGLRRIQGGELPLSLRLLQRGPRPTTRTSSRRRQDSGRVSHHPELDRRDAPRQRPLRATAASRSTAGNGSTRALPTRRSRPDADSDQGRVWPTHSSRRFIHSWTATAASGDCLITLLLCSEGVLSRPLLYLSLYLKRNRDTYYDRLQAFVPTARGSSGSNSSLKESSRLPNRPPAPPNASFTWSRVIAKNYTA